ncbi:hypothetical protein RchiOBHm_Chr2g0154161 [Rosa chinensis]|uniref:Uncharacterized protein n=1 Tax=Rosa chinensis TaxID=74649 RepID=A0A2P6S0W9_ROSCH|nr:hypothetical protein RchiOBHm_Chr2g0154161 [Rosa chinensis]
MDMGKNKSSLRKKQGSSVEGIGMAKSFWCLVKMKNRVLLLVILAAEYGYG